MNRYYFIALVLGCASLLLWGVNYFYWHSSSKFLDLAFRLGNLSILLLLVAGAFGALIKTSIINMLKAEADPYQNLIKEGNKAQNKISELQAEADYLDTSFSDLRKQKLGDAGAQAQKKRQEMLNTMASWEKLQKSKADYVAAQQLADAQRKIWADIVNDIKEDLTKNPKPLDKATVDKLFAQIKTR